MRKIQFNLDDIYEETGPAQPRRQPGIRIAVESDKGEPRGVTEVVCLNDHGATPHQAPQRWNVTSNKGPQARREIVGRRTQWKTRLRENSDSPFPTLLDILEPEVVWEHSMAYEPSIGKIVEGAVSVEEFLEFYHRAGKPAYGVYEGTYNDLMKAIGELGSVLEPASICSEALKEVKDLEIEKAVLPEWDDYKPAESEVPPRPQEMAVYLPTFDPPPFTPSSEFVAPTDLPEVPPLVPEWKPVPAPVWREPEPPPIKEFIPPEFENNVPQPVMPTPPEPLSGAPRFGADWTGQKPHQKKRLKWPMKTMRTVISIEAQPPELPEEPLLEPAPIPIPLPDIVVEQKESEESSQTTSLHMRNSTTETLVSETVLVSAISGPPAKESSAVPSPNLPVSQNDGSIESQATAKQPATPRGDCAMCGCNRQGEPGKRCECGSAWAILGNAEDDVPPVWCLRCPGKQQQQQRAFRQTCICACCCPTCSKLVRCECGNTAALYAEGRTSTPRWCDQCPGRPQHGCLYIAGERCECGNSVARFADAGLEEGYQLHGMRFCLNPPLGNRLGRYCKDCPKLKQLEAVDTIWEICRCDISSSGVDVDLTPPAPLQLPQKPDLPPAPERAPDPPDTPMPEKEPPILEEEPPEWVEPVMHLPKYADPRQPTQGILSGTAPVLILDASGTMNPRMGGRFPTVKNIAAQLLSPDEGQIRNTAGMFDVIAYSGQAWAWSATCKRKYAMLKENKGGNVRGRPYSGAPTSSTLRQLRERGNMQEQVAKPEQWVHLMRTSPEFLVDAQEWVNSWPSPAGVTNLKAALALMESSDSHSHCDSVYLFSDGNVSDPNGTIQWVEDWATRKGKLPPFHCVGFFSVGSDGGAGARFLKELAAMTGGTYREFDKVTAALLKHGSEHGFGGDGDTPEVVAERLWAENKLRELRQQNVKAGRIESPGNTLKRLRELHHTERVKTAEAVFKMQRNSKHQRYISELERVRAQNASAEEQAVLDHQAECERVQEDNEKARQEFHDKFGRSYLEWESECASITRAWEVTCLRMKEEWATLNAEFLVARAKQEEPRFSAGHVLIKRLAGDAYQPGLSPRDIPNTNPTEKASPRGNEKVEPLRATSGDGLGGTRAAAHFSATGAVDAHAADANEQCHQGESAGVVPDPSGTGISLPPGSNVEEIGFGGGSKTPRGDGDQQLGEEDVDQELEQRRQQAIERRRAVEEQNTEIYSEWRRRRLQQLERYKGEVDKAYGNHFADHMMVEWAMSQARATEELQADIHKRARATAQLQRENRASRFKHYAEVEIRRQQQKEFDEENERYNTAREEALRQYQADVAKAKEEHNKVIDRAIEQHQIEAAEFLAEWERTSRAEAWADWEAEVGATGRLNKQKAQEVEEERARHFAAIAKGKSIVHAAREEFDRKIAQEEVAYEARLVVLRQEHDKECATLVADQKAAQKQALLDWVTLKRKIEMTNQENLTKARRQFQRDAQEAKQEEEENTLRLEEEHKAAVIEAREHNKAVQPLLDKAAIALRELKRVQVFSANISRCAEKMYVGVNLMPTPTPQLDRVVEMSSLLESLRLAYEEYPMYELPWPNREQPGMPDGTGCWTVNATPRKTLGRVVEHSTMLKTLSVEADRRISARHRQAILETSGKGSQSPRPPRTPRQGENIRTRPLSSHRRRLTPSSMPSQELRSRPKTAPPMGRMNPSYLPPPTTASRPQSGRAGVSPRARLAQEWFIPDPTPPKDLRQAKKVKPPSARRQK